MRALSVLHIDTERGWRGGERQVLWLAEALMRAGHRSLIAARPGEELARRAAALGVGLVSCAPVGEVDPRCVLALRRVIDREDVSVVHAHTGHAVMLGALAVAGTGARLVLTRRVDFPLQRNVLTRWKYRRADAIVAISEAVARELAEYGCSGRGIEIVPDGVDLARPFAPADPAILAGCGVRVGSPLVVMAAALVDHKDPLTFVRAMAVVRRSVPDVQALLVGDGPLRPLVGAAVEAAGLEGVVHLTGFRADVDALVSAADVVALSSKQEGSGSILLDALMWGRPVAATQAGGIPELLGQGVALLAPVGDAAALGAAITRLLCDPVLAQQLAAAGRCRVTDYSMDGVAARMVAIYRRVTTADGAPARAYGDVLGAKC